MKIAPMGPKTFESFEKAFPELCKELFKDSKSGSKMKLPYYLGDRAKKELKKLIIDK